ncbi:MAG: transcriptional regulator, TetR family [Acidimicrobiales bacterium]|jgi:AcrR family transcriptional regulator|nr:transcriptional regulator, TetR family [Acidimicrobiales bacterium]
MSSLRQRHTERTRDAIVAAAFELFASKGYAETTIDEIAERADIAPRTFFRYFPAKEAVLFHNSDGQVDEAVAKLRDRPTDETPYESLLAVLRSMAAEVAHGDTREIMLAKFAAENDRLFEHHRAVVMCNFEESITEVFKERAGDEFDGLAIDAAVAAVLATFGTAMRSWIRAGATDDFEPILERCVTAAQGAFQSVPAAAPR